MKIDLTITEIDDLLAALTDRINVFRCYADVFTEIIDKKRMFKVMDKLKKLQWKLMELIENEQVQKTNI